MNIAVSDHKSDRGRRMIAALQARDYGFYEGSLIAPVSPIFFCPLGSLPRFVTRDDQRGFEISWRQSGRSA